MSLRSKPESWFITFPSSFVIVSASITLKISHAMFFPFNNMRLPVDLISFRESMECNCKFLCVAIPCTCFMLFCSNLCRAACLSYIIHFVAVRESQRIHCSRLFTLWQCILGSSLTPLTCCRSERVIVQLLVTWRYVI